MLKVKIFNLFSTSIRHLKVIIQARVRGLLPISKHREVKNTRRRRELRVVLRSEEDFLAITLTYFSNKPVFCEKIKMKACLIYLISASNFQTLSTVLIFFVLDFKR